MSVPLIFERYKKPENKKFTRISITYRIFLSLIKHIFKFSVLTNFKSL